MVTYMVFVKSNEKILTELRSYIDGLVISDGSINKSGSYVQSCIHKEWLEVICDCFSRYNIICKVDNGVQSADNLKNGWKGSYIYKIWTDSYSDFLELRNIWYELDFDKMDKRRNGKDYWVKKVPDDLIISPFFLANWLMGDGTVDYGIGRQRIILCCMRLNNKEAVIDKMNSFFGDDYFYLYSAGICCASREGVKKFIDCVRPYIVKCFDYKVPDLNLYVKKDKGNLRKRI